MSEKPKDCPLNCDCSDHNELAMPQSEAWEREFDNCWTRRNKDTGEFEERWFIKENSTPKDIKHFIRTQIEKAELKGHALARASAVVEIDEAYQRGLKEAGLNCKLDHDTAYDRGKAEQFEKDCAEDEEWEKEKRDALIASAVQKERERTLGEAYKVFPHPYFSDLKAIINPK